MGMNTEKLSSKNFKEASFMTLQMESLANNSEVNSSPILIEQSVERTHSFFYLN